jgi:hypothetical protein
VYPMELNVPKALRPALESLAPKPMRVPPRQGEAAPALREGEPTLAGGPRYRVTVQWGRSLEPWIVGVERMK